LAVSSPTLILSFAAIAGPVVADLDLRNTPVLTAFIAGFVCCGLLWSMLIAWLGSHTARLGQGAVRAMSLLSAVLFLAFAVHLFWNGLQNLIDSR
jgi:L-lysine exporter family protein LysE/ArgO